MPDFEVGDLVEVLDAGDCGEYYSIGDRGIVTKVSSYDVLVDFNNHATKVLDEGVWYVELPNIKLINKGK